jgi:hypothetical protein
MTSGWLSNWDATANTYRGEPVVGFFWNVAEGSGFTFPYVDAALFRLRDMLYLGRPYVFSGSGTFMYADGAPNARGDVGVTLGGVFSGTIYQALLINDDYNGAPPPWTVMYPFNSAAGVGPSNDRWGDYQRVQPHSPAALQWIATGWHINTASGDSHPHYMIFGRERDNKSLNRWILN